MKAFQIHPRVSVVRLGIRAACLGMLLGVVGLATTGAVVQAATIPILPATLNPLTVGTPVNIQLVITCSTGSPTGTTSGALPAGLNSTGLISGTPTTTGTYSWTLTAT